MAFWIDSGSAKMLGSRGFKVWSHRAVVAEIASAVFLLSGQETCVFMRLFQTLALRVGAKGTGLGYLRASCSTHAYTLA